MKKLFKKRTFIGAALTLVLLGFGIPNAPMIAQLGTGVYCEAAECQ